MSAPAVRPQSGRSSAKAAAVCLLGVLLPAAAAQAQALTEVWRLGGFNAPESAMFDPATGQIVVSQMGAFGPEADGRLSLVSPEGAMIEADWVTGLVDPKGMAVVDGTLHVADPDRLHRIDMATGEQVGPIPVPGAQLLNDVAADAEGTVYVSDMLAGSIYRIQGEAVDQVLPEGGLSLPNGLLVDDGNLLVGSFGEGLADDLSVASPGGLWRLDLASGKVAPVPGTEASGSVDGIARLGQRVIYDDFQTGRILALSGDELTTLAETARTAADLGTAGDLLLVPVTAAGEVIAYRLAPE
ncbi:hypothetical protein GI374_01045 [Paracoccus sp. S-4012]|uniref:hypothetical protein n=1 Tax=Paracoccus sp. S-4012 TaxID=2665648 RepID=UPI0012AF54A6|nr:hypothetical protein [Paracoccus sp. S-4012]MRX49044.1 hypothetical protein [Paracoccus sp. S-4012]